MHKTMLLFALPILLVACNNSSNTATTDNDTANKKMNADTMHNMTTTATVPDLPAVPDGAKVYFKNLKNDQKINSPVKIEMGVDKMRVDTVGPVVAGSGHFHIFIDAEDSLASGTVVPKDSTHLHYGKGQKEATIPLTPGKHKLTLQFADGIHRSYGGRLATTVNVDVKK